MILITHKISQQHMDTWLRGNKFIRQHQVAWLMPYIMCWKCASAGLVEAGSMDMSVWACGHLLILILIRGNSWDFFVHLLLFDVVAILCIIGQHHMIPA